MDYEKKYKEALERAKIFIEANPLVQNLNTWIKETFPELAEGEDEMIRKLLVEAVTQVLQDQYCSNRGVSKEKVVAWLERQGEQKVSYTTIVETGNGGINALVTREITNGCDEQKTAWSEDETSIAIKNPDAYKIGFADGEAHAKEEMQSSWSEEDRKMINKLMAVVKLYYVIDGDLDKQSCLSWLESFKQRIGG